MPVRNDDFVLAFVNQSLQAVTVRQPTELDFEGIEILTQSIYQMAKLNHLKELTLSIVTEQLLDLDLQSVNKMIQTAVLTLLEDLSDKLVRISFSGSWVNDELIDKMPRMSRLEVLDLTPYDHFRHGFIPYVNLSTSSVVNFARTKCPVLLEPRFLVHNFLFRRFQTDSSEKLIPMKFAVEVSLYVAENDAFNKELYQFLDQKDTLPGYIRRKRFSQLRSSNEGVYFDHSFAKWKKYSENGL